MMNMEVAPSSSPTKTIFRPSRLASAAPTSGMVKSVAIPPGAMTMPALVAEYPIRVCRNSGISMIEL